MPVPLHKLKMTINLLPVNEQLKKICKLLVKQFTNKVYTESIPNQVTSIKKNHASWRHVSTYHFNIYFSIKACNCISHCYVVPQN